MDKTDDLSCGQIVSSKSGRDKHRLFVVMRIISDDYVLLADGALRKVEKPKKKNVKHLTRYNRVLPSIAEKIKNNKKIENNDLRRELEPLELWAFQEESKGGF